MHVVNTKAQGPKALPGPAHRCVVAASLADPRFRKRLVRSKKNYQRHDRHKGRRYD